MTAQPHNRFVFCVMVVEFAINGNQTLSAGTISLGLQGWKMEMHMTFKNRLYLQSECIEKHQFNNVQNVIENIFLKPYSDK